MFSLRGLRLYFPSTGALGYVVCFTPRHLPGLSMPKCGAGGSATHCSACPVLRQAESGPLGLSVHACGVAGSASGQTACPVSPSLCQSRSRHGKVSPLCPGCPSPPRLPVWMNVSFLSPWSSDSPWFNFLSVLVVFVFKLLLSFFWLCEEAQCVYLHLHLGSP